MAAVESWVDVHPGDVVTVKFPYHARCFRVRVSRVDVASTNDTYAFVVGQRLTMSGRPSRLRTHRGCPPGERVEFVYIDYVTATDRADICPTCEQASVPAQHKTPLGEPCRGRTYAPPRILEPGEAYGLAVAEYVVRGGNPDDVMVRLQARFGVGPVSVGDNGLTARPAVFDRVTGHTIKVFRKPEQHLAEALAVKLNAEDREE